MCLIRDVLRLGWKPAVSAAPLQKSSPPSLLLWIGLDRIFSKIGIDFSHYPQNFYFLKIISIFIHFWRITYEIIKKNMEEYFFFPYQLISSISDQNNMEMLYFVSPHFVKGGILFRSCMSEIKFKPSSYFDCFKFSVKN